MGILNKMKCCAKDAEERYKYRVSHKVETKKFNDSRRVEIYSKIKLSDEQKKAIDEFYIEHYGKKIPYTWHRHYTAFTGKFDVNYFPELLYIPEFERYENMLISGSEYVFEDKNLIPVFSAAAGIKCPKTVGSCVRGGYRTADNRLVSIEEFAEEMKNVGKVFAKPSVGSCSGRNCVVLNLSDGIDTNSEKVFLK